MLRIASRRTNSLRTASQFIRQSVRSYAAVPNDSPENRPLVTPLGRQPQNIHQKILVLDQLHLLKF